MSSFCAPSFDQLHLCRTLRTESPSIFLDKSTYLGKIEATLLSGYLCRSHSRSYNFPQVNPLDPEAFMSTTGVMHAMF